MGFVFGFIAGVLACFMVMAFAAGIKDKRPEMR